MSKTEIKREVYQCDHSEHNGDQCSVEGDREAIKACGVCNRDLCITHYELTTVTIQGTRDHFTYYFCPNHNDEFMDTLVKKFGDTKPIPQTGYGLNMS